MKHIEFKELMNRVKNRETVGFAIRAMDAEDGLYQVAELAVTFQSTDSITKEFSTDNNDICVGNVVAVIREFMAQQDNYHWSIILIYRFGSATIIHLSPSSGWENIPPTKWSPADHRQEIPELSVDSEPENDEQAEEVQPPARTLSHSITKTFPQNPDCNKIVYVGTNRAGFEILANEYCSYNDKVGWYVKVGYDVEHVMSYLLQEMRKLDA